MKKKMSSMRLQLLLRDTGYFLIGAFAILAIIIGFMLAWRFGGLLVVIKLFLFAASCLVVGAVVKGE